MIVGFMDLYWFARQDMLAAFAVASGAQAAALGAKDYETVEQAVVISQDALKEKNIQVTPCALRTVGSTAKVSGELYLVPLTALYEPFWYATGRLGRPIHHEASLRVLAPCGEIIP